MTLISDSLYHELILDLYRNPLHKKKLDTFDIAHHEINPLCGDEVSLFIKWDESDKVADIGWIGGGCAISQAASSWVTNFALHKTKDELRSLTIEALAQELGLTNLNPTRLRCASLTLKGLQKML